MIEKKQKHLLKESQTHYSKQEEEILLKMQKIKQNQTVLNELITDLNELC